MNRSESFQLVTTGNRYQSMNAGIPRESEIGQPVQCTFIHKSSTSKWQQERRVHLKYFLLFNPKTTEKYPYNVRQKS